MSLSGGQRRRWALSIQVRWLCRLRRRAAAGLPGRAVSRQQLPADVPPAPPAPPLALQLLRNPAGVLLDEPTSGLDSTMALVIVQAGARLSSATEP